MKRGSLFAGSGWPRGASPAHGIVVGSKASRSHRERARASIVAATTLALLGIGAPRPSRAETVYELDPSISVGATDNALASPTGQVHDPDGFGRAGLAARARYRGLRSAHALALQLARTQFINGRAADSSSADLGLASTMNLTPNLNLTLGASAVLSRTTGVTFVSPDIATPQGMLAAPLTYFSTGVTETLDHTATPRLSYTETLAFAQLRYLTDVIAIPTATALTGRLKGGLSFARDTFSLEGVLTDSYVPGTVSAFGATGVFAHGNVFLASLLAGWRRELSMRWSTELQGGALAIFTLDGDSLIAPAGRAALEFHRIPWFATLVVSQTPASNLFLGQVTVTDQALARVALPLDIHELIVVSGVGGYTYARVADAEGRLVRGYDQWSAGASFAARLARLPFTGALEYSMAYQSGNSGSGGTIPSLVRQTVMLTVSGTFLFGPGTPPLLSGVR